MTVLSALSPLVNARSLAARRRRTAPRADRASTLLVLLFLLGAVAGGPAAAQSLYGSHESLVRQNLVAQQHGYAYLRNTQELMQAVASGELVPIRGNEDFELAGDEVSFPYARAEVKTFLIQLAHDYHAACGEPLVVTSLTRPISRQPWNASPISVHPTGMAVDLRRSDRRACRQWLESTLLALEAEGMVQATREHWPPHYHVAVFPDPLLLPGPIGDPNGVTRVAALAALHQGPLTETELEPEPAARHARVHVTRSARTGRLSIAQTSHPSPHPTRAARGQAAREGRIVIHRHGATHHTPPHHGTAGHETTVTAAAKHHHPRPHTRTTTVTAR